MFERFTQAARAVVVYAQEESRLRGDQDIGTQHLVLGLTHDLTDTSRALREAGFDVESGQRQLELMSASGVGPAGGHIPFTPHAKRALEDAARQGHAQIAPPQLLLGVLGIGDGQGVRLLIACGVDVDALASKAGQLAEASERERGGRQGHDRDLRYVHDSGDEVPDHISQERRLRAALVRYGRHEDGCRPARGCTCGLDQVLAESHDGA